MMYNILKANNPLEGIDNNIFLLSTLTLYRNIEGYHFPGKLDRQSQQQIEALLEEAFSEMGLLKGGGFFRAETLDPIQKEYLFEHFVSSESFTRASVGEAFVVDEEARLFVIVNFRNHLHIEYLDSSGDLGEALDKLIALESRLGGVTPYAFSPRYGFLTAKASRCGTGLVVHSYLHIPALIHTGAFEEFCSREDVSGIAVRGMQGDLKQGSIGDIVVVHNTQTIGLTEENIIHSLQSFVTKIEIAEKDVRTVLKKEGNLGIKDKISRALGIMKHACQLQTAETLGLLSLVKLGVDLGWVDGIDQVRVNEAFFCCRRAHLYRHYNGEVPVEELDVKRAEYVREILDGVTLSL